MTDGTSEKRFVIPKESIGYERLNKTQEVIEQVKKNYPEILSLCVFGSSTKGRSVEKSDIDGYLFVDAQVVAEKIGASENEVLVTEVNKTVYSETSSVYFVDDIGDRYNHLVRTGVKEKLGLSDEQVKHLRTRPISREIIDERVEDWKNWDADMQEYRKQSEDHCKKWEAGDYSSMGPDVPEFMDTRYLPYMFHLAIGKGIQEYREYLIAKLTKLGDSGERIWVEVIKGTEEMENHLRAGTEIYYPKTLTEATQQYSLRTLTIDPKKEPDLIQTPLKAM